MIYRMERRNFDGSGFLFATTTAAIMILVIPVAMNMMMMMVGTLLPLVHSYTIPLHQQRQLRYGSCISSSSSSSRNSGSSTCGSQQSHSRHRYTASSSVSSSSSSLAPGPASVSQLRVVSSSLNSDSNVVLRPSSSDAESAFDNWKVGNCRVHRYSSSTTTTTTGTSTDGSGSMTEYVMWYHGRDRQLDTTSTSSSPNTDGLNDNDDGVTKTTTTTSSAVPLPPLSTGRIGRATSRNGLVWEKDVIGSSSEDRIGVALGLNIESWWSFDTAHVGLGCVLLPLSTPAVLSADGIYLMYYMGGNHQETSIMDYVDQQNEEDEKKQETSTTTRSMSDAKVRGMNMKIGVAISQDGISWGRVEGDDPSGACMVPYSKHDPNQQQQQQQQQGNKGYEIPEELYCAWPEVIVNETPNAPNEAFVMYYSAMIIVPSQQQKNDNDNDTKPTTTTTTKQKVVCYAVSEDGFRWYKRGTCIVPSVSSSSGNNINNDMDGCARCFVYQDATYNVNDMTWTTSSPSSYTMYYEGISNIDHKHRIYMATSTDGFHWTKSGSTTSGGGGDVVLDIGPPNAWDCNGVGSPHCIRLDDGTIRMYYTGQGIDGSTAIGVAKLVSYDTDAVWVREQASITFATVAD